MIRILITAHPFGLIQMTAYIERLRREKKADHKTFLFLTPFNIPTICGFDTRTHIEQTSELCRRIAEQASIDVVFRILDIPEKLSLAGFTVTKPNQVIQQRKLSNHYIRVFRSLLETAGIRPDQIGEIWKANSPLDKAAQKIAPSAKMTVFEHGLSDFNEAIRFQTGRLSELGRPNWLTRPYRLLEQILIGVPRVLRIDSHVSLLTDLLYRAGVQLSYDTVPFDILRSTIREVSKTNSALMDLKRVDGTWCLLLWDTISMHNHSISESKQYFTAYMQYVTEVLPKILRNAGIQNILIKRRMDVYQDIANCEITVPDQLAAEFNVVVTNDPSLIHVPAEIIALTITPPVILGVLSSALFYIPALCPGTQTYTSHAWHCEYTKTRLDVVHHDYIWLHNTFYGNESKFTNWAPNLLPVKQHSSDLAALPHADTPATT